MSAILKNTKRILACASFISLMLLFLFAFISYAFPQEKKIPEDVMEQLSKDLAKLQEQVFLLFGPNPIISQENAIQKIFTLTINSKQVIVILPEALPEMETATFKGEGCFNLIICLQRFCLNARAPDHDHIDFVYTIEGKIIALVWIKTLEAVYVAWKYVNGIPIISNIEEIKSIISEAEKPKATKDI